MKKTTLKPFIKWIGGKTQLLPFLDIVIPSKFNTYYEPFLGGGALFLHLQPHKAILNDINSDLILVWQNLIKHSSKIIQILKELNEQLKKDGESFYWQIRDEYNQSIANIRKTALFIFLNKTCFNGIYRVNRKNEFNVPFNKKTDLTLSSLIDIENIKKILFYFQKYPKIEFFCHDYQIIIDRSQKDDFLFVDPPYDSDNNSFDAYTHTPFGKEGQKRLFETLNKAHHRGVKWLLTNHDTPYINKLYSEFYLNRISVSRFINSDSSKRKNNHYETIITNYPITTNKLLELNYLSFKKELRTTTYNLNSYIDWNKIDTFLTKYNVEINELNTLFSSSLTEFKSKIEYLFKMKKTECFSILPFLIAKKHSKEDQLIFLNKENQEFKVDFTCLTSILNFVEESGLLQEIFLNPTVHNIQSLLLGVKIGLNSNTNKNKTGKMMMFIISEILKKNNIEFQTEVTLKDIFVNNELKETKKIDFVFKIQKTIFLLKCSFFNVVGSKINSEFSSFIDFNKTIKQFKDKEFIYVVDGIGLKNISNPLKAALENIEHFYNIQRFENFIITMQKNH
ncbi:DpnII family type II restriction endonuclease ['Cynodon dactylon' phytoplasma]|uniref:DpnII family type II restriction endonuclease n=1 Tax='Cynodon dactylon' phytoplasma TaxID=295320 RepID=UPI001265C79D|nr:DpnII family type II restriction endonuclease ['Cynodon dactylon' phytoplasma]KAB8121677.1 Dam family site-specific DNA-(adenine-N6)-methyltransferase ['Cynodon dactylon' phytoplasma]